jgi:hypothetical protein
MFLPRLLTLALATSALIASAQTTITGTYNTGAGKTAGSTDAKRDVNRFTSSSGLNIVTGATGLATYLSSTPSSVTTARDASPFSSSWVTPTAASNSLWLSLAADASGQAIHDPSNGGGYAFILDLGTILNPVASLSQPVSLSFSLRGDNGFSVHLLSNASGSGYSESASLLGSTESNFGAAAGTKVSFTGAIDRSTELLILLSNDTQTSGNPGGILVQNFSLTYSAIPEPATYAAIFGIAVLGITLWSRRRRS